ncbi:MAG TPA: hypothetical protein VOA64_17865 [Candidatus Dormibacteraeota bacterium]|nr:hypothetical protein [Candidatus Dormibacteraeota bacterium]
MSNLNWNLYERTGLLTIAVLVVTPLITPGMPAGRRTGSNQTSKSAAPDRWLHIRVVNSDSKGETVRVNVPLELAEKVLPTINKERLQHGKVKIDQARLNDVDLHSLMDAIHSAKDGEYVTVLGADQDLRVAKQGGQLLVHVLDKSGNHKSKNSQVEIKMPMNVVDALFSAGKDELDIVAALHALSTQGDTELVSVKDKDNTVRIWLDSKNLTE